MTKIPFYTAPEAEFLARVGEGAYGEVLLARFPGGAFRAVKYVAAADPSRAAAVARERRAVRLLASFADPADPSAVLHPSLVPVLDRREGDGGTGPFAYAMPLADSLRPNWRADPEAYRPRTLASDLVSRRALPAGECLALAEALAGALDFLQRRCLVHRDVKPSNVLYLSGKPVLADPGLLADTREAESVVGTPGYVPDEQHGRFSADLYSLGVLLLEALTGHPAAERGFAPVEEADISHPLFPKLLALFERAADPSPARRPQTAAAFLKELHALSAPARPAPRRKRRVLLLFCLTIFLAAAAGFFLWRQTRPLPPEPVPPPAVPEVASSPATASPAPSSATEVPAASPIPVAVEAATNTPLLYVSADQADAGVFLQLYTDRIRVGLPLPDSDPADSALLLVYPAENSFVPAPCRLVSPVAADDSNTPPGFADVPAFPESARADRRSRTGIAFLPSPGDFPDAAAYPEVVLFLPEPRAWREWLAEHPQATFEQIESLWVETYELPSLRRRFEGDGAFPAAFENIF